jgi:hypothetical protein
MVMVWWKGNGFLLKWKRGLEKKFLQLITQWINPELDYIRLQHSCSQAKAVQDATLALTLHRTISNKQQPRDT